VAILREQGVNGHVEMAAAFDRAGFTSIDVPHDTNNGRSQLICRLVRFSVLLSSFSLPSRDFNLSLILIHNIIK
jgi:phosphoribosylformylglycinamidine (FGAM) synthase-like amidotransferase family enzyme